MSTDSNAADVFEAVEADPDAILEECDAETPTELVESGGKHEAGLEDEVDDVTAAELFADLEDEIGDSNSNREPDSAETNRTDAVDESDRLADLAFEFVGDADVTVQDDGDVIDATAAELEALTGTDPNSEPATDGDDLADTTAATDSHSSAAGAAPGTLTVTTGTGDRFELVGPAPTTTRVSNDTFGSAGTDVY